MACSPALVTIVAFDTLRFAKRLEEAGVPAPQAAATASAFAEAVGEVLATKQDLENEARDIRDEIAGLGRELRAEIAALRQEMKDEITALRQEMRGEITALRRDMKELELRMTIKLGAMMAGSIALVGAMVKLL